MPEWTILDPHGSPYGGERDNHNSFVVIGGSSYESEAHAGQWTYGEVLDDAELYGRDNVSGRA